MGKHKSKKPRSSSSSSCTSSSSDSSREEIKKLKKLKKKLKKEQRKAEKILKKKIKTERKRLKKKQRSSSSTCGSNSSLDKKLEITTSDIPLELMEKSKAMAPMTREEWENKQNVIRKVLDEETGRYRLIKGDGEVLEEIVSRDRHKEINRQATRADGAYFQSRTVERKRM